jgi:hypothetical protein
VINDRVPTSLVTYGKGDLNGRHSRNLIFAGDRIAERAIASWCLAGVVRTTGLRQLATVRKRRLGSEMDGRPT